MGTAKKVGPQYGMAGCSADRRGYVAARGPTKAKLAWKKKLAKGLTSPVIAADGTVFVGLSDGKLCAIAPASGKLSWSMKGRGEILGAPAITHDGTVWFGTVKGILYGVSPSGADRRELDLRSPLTAPLAAHPDGTLYALAQSGTLYAIRNGKIAWRAATKRYAYYLMNGPAITADGGAVFCGGDLKLHAVGPDGAALWQKDVKGAPIIGLDGNVYFATPRDGVVCVKSKNGTPVWSRKPREIHPRMSGECGGLAQDGAGAIYVSSMSADASVHALSLDGKKVLRSLPANNWIRRPATVDQVSNVFFGSLANVYAYDRKGKQLWSAPLPGELVGPLALGNDGSLFGSTTTGFLCAYR